MRRHVIGLITGVLFLAALYLSLWPLEGSANNQFLLGALVRVGALMAVIWLAYHELCRLPAWLWAVLPALLAVAAVRPRWFLLALPIVIALAILKPRMKK